MPDKPVFRVQITSTGLLDVQAETQAEALAMVERAIRHNGLALAGKVLMNPTAVLRPVLLITTQPAASPDLKVHALMAEGLDASIKSDKVG